MFKSLIRFVFYLILFGFVTLNFRYVAVQAGLVWDKIGISGTGSMYPTFPKGQGDNPAVLASQTVIEVRMRRFPAGITFFGKTLFGYGLQHGDIVSFTNAETEAITKEDTGTPSGFVKRVIALPGDTVEIRDGFVWLDGKQLVEPYIAVARSTFGGSILPDCRKLQIPGGSVFVLGDNRKGSSDSRYELGLVHISDIDHVLPYVDQKLYSAHWRDASKDFLEANKPTLDIKEYVRLLNEKRVLNSLKPLTFQSKLAGSAKLRAENIIKYDDFSFAATVSGYTMEKAMKDVGYTNIVWGEAPTVGYYGAQELIDNFFQFSDTKKFLMQSDFQETGIAAEVGNINGCPVQVVVQHFAGYKPPNYSRDLVQSWQQGLDNLRKVFPGWQATGNKPIINLFQTRINRMQAIVSRLNANQWLTNEEQQWMKDDASLARELQSLTTKFIN